MGRPGPGKFHGSGLARHSMDELRVPQQVIPLVRRQHQAHQRHTCGRIRLRRHRVCREGNTVVARSFHVHLLVSRRCFPGPANLSQPPRRGGCWADGLQPLGPRLHLPPNPVLQLLLSYLALGLRSPTAFRPATPVSRLARRGARLIQLHQCCPGDDGGGWDVPSRSRSFCKLPCPREKEENTGCLVAG